MDIASEPGVRGTSFRVIPQSIKIINNRAVNIFKCTDKILPTLEVKCTEIAVTSFLSYQMCEGMTSVCNFINEITKINNSSILANLYVLY